MPAPEPGADASPASAGTVPTTVTFGAPPRDWWHDVPTEASLRVVPLLRVPRDGADGADGAIVVGQVHLRLKDGGLTARAYVTGAWVRSGADWQPMPDDGRPGLASAMAAAGFPLPAGGAAEAPGDPTAVVAVLAKTVAEESRGAVADLRDLRYRAESSLAEQLRPDHRDTVLPTLATLLELGVICGRAADEARETVREGLWAWLTDPDAYQAYRASQDSTLLTGHAPADHATRPWMRAHDAAVRQCRAMEEQLGAETGVIAGLLDAAATVASARESESQQLFNTLVGVAALGLGLPALVLSLYGADRLVPLTSLRQALALLPIALAAAVAGVVAVRRLPTGRTHTHVLGTTLVVLALMLLLVVAGVLAPGAS